MADTQKILIDVEVQSNIEEISKLTIEVKKLREQNKELSKDYNTNSESIELNRATIANLSKTIRQKQTVLQAEIKNLDESSGAYARLNMQSQIASQRAKDLAVSYGIESKQAKEAVESARQLQERLLSVDSSMGQNQRNVGNYKSGYNALGNSINQLTREAPAFANSMQTGFMAISNNIPTMVDAINQVKEKNKELASEGKKTTSIWKSLGSSIFSWMTLLSVGITLLTLYGKDAVNWIMSIGQATDNNSVKQAKYNELLAETYDNNKKIYDISQKQKQESLKNAESQIDLNKKIYDNAVKTAKEELQLAEEQLRQVKSTDEAKILSIDKRKKLDANYARTFEMLNEVAREKELNNIDDDEKKKLDTAIKSQQKILESKIKADDEYKKNLRDADKNYEDKYFALIKAQEDEDKKNKEKRLKREKELKKAQEDRIKYINQMERLRLAALSLLDDDYQLKQDEIHKKHREAMTAIKNDDIMTQTEKTFYILALEKHMYKQIEESKKAHFDYMAKIQSDSIDSINAVELIKAKDNQRALTNLLIELETEKLTKLQNQETDGSQVQEKLKLQRIAEQEAKINGLKVNIQDLNYNQELDKALDNEDQIYEIKRTALNNALALTKDNADEEARIKKELFDLEQANNDRLLAQRVAIANQTLSIATSLSNAYKANEDKQLNKTTEANDKKKESLKAQMDAGIITQEKYNKEVAKLDKEADKQKAIIARKQAIRNRNLALFQITINTAEAVAEANPSIPLMALAAGIGVAEALVVTNTEIPKARKGMYIKGKSHEQGGEYINVEGGEVVMKKEAVSMYRNQLSAMNVSAGGVSFGNGGTIGFNDGGYSMRNNQYGMNGMTKADLVEALQGLTIVTTIEDIKREEKKYNKITSSGTF